MSSRLAPGRPWIRCAGISNAHQFVRARRRSCVAGVVHGCGYAGLCVVAVRRERLGLRGVEAATSSASSEPGRARCDRPPSGAARRGSACSRRASAARAPPGRWPCPGWSVRPGRADRGASKIPLSEVRCSARCCLTGWTATLKGRCARRVSRAHLCTPVSRLGDVPCRDLPPWIRDLTTC
jgi:hypothetical protein